MRTEPVATESLGGTSPPAGLVKSFKPVHVDLMCVRCERDPPAAHGKCHEMQDALAGMAQDGLQLPKRPDLEYIYAVPVKDRVAESLLPSRLKDVLYAAQRL